MQDRSLQFIIHALLVLYRIRHKSLFVLLTPIDGDPFFEEPIVMALFLEV